MPYVRGQCRFGGQWSCLELPVEGGDEEADELIVRVRGAVRHEWLQEVVDVVVAPCRKPRHFPFYTTRQYSAATRVKN